MAAKRCWVYTLNNYTDEEVELVQTIEAVYHVFAKEIAPTTGTPHLQGYLRLSGSGKRLGGMKKLPGMGRANFTLEATRGTDQENRAYSTKTRPQDKVPNAWVFEMGTMAEQGKRNDIVAAREVLDRTGSIREVFDLHPNYQTLKMAEMYLTKCVKSPFERPMNIRWYWGPTGSGKSHAARHEAGPGAWAGSTMQWWNGYDGEENIVFDDFRPGFCSWNQLLQYTDKWACQVPFKGGMRSLHAKNIWFTAPEPPEKMLAFFTGEDVTQFTRRISSILEFNPREIQMPTVGIYVPPVLVNEPGHLDSAIPPVADVAEVGGNTGSPSGSPAPTFNTLQPCAAFEAEEVKEAGVRIAGHPSHAGRQPVGPGGTSDVIRTGPDVQLERLREDLLQGYLEPPVARSSVAKARNSRGRFQKKLQG